jgi:hypothetical protein
VGEGRLAGIGAVLKILAEGTGDFENALTYLANEIEHHTKSAYDADVQLFGLNDFSEKWDGPGPLVLARIGGAA